MLYSHEKLQEIPHILSEPRFATYLKQCENEKQRALQLYQWNMEISSAFIIPLHLLEISIRNTAVEAIEHVHGANWPWNNGFIRGLPNPKKGYSAQRDLKRVAKEQPTTGKVVAELKFIFWEKMFTKSHDKKLWNLHIKELFPFAPSAFSAQNLRSEAHIKIRQVRSLRNRIAHHEPIFSRRLETDYEAIHTLVSWRSKIASEWLNDIQKVTPHITSYPEGKNELLSL